MSSWLQSLHIMPPPPLCGADISTPTGLPFTPGKSCTHGLPHGEPDAGSHSSLSLCPVRLPTCGLLSKHKGAPAYSGSLSEADLKQSDHVALSHPTRSRRPVLLRPLPAGSCGSSESWPWPKRERNCFHSSEAEETSFHLPQIKLQPGDISTQDPNRELETGSPPTNSQDLQPFLDSVVILFEPDPGGPT